MESGARRVALCMVALLLALSGALASFAQSRQTQNNWQQQQQQQQQQFWQQQRNQQQFLQQQQRQQAEKAQREQRLREAERAARQAENQRNRANGNLPGGPRSADRSSTYARPPASAVRATPPLDAAKLTPAQIKAGFKGQFANGRALVTFGKKTFAINPNGISGKPRMTVASSKPKAKPGPAITTRLTALHISGRPQSGGKEPPRGSQLAANDNSAPSGIKLRNGLDIFPKPGITTTIIGDYKIDMKRIIENNLKIPKNIDFGPKLGRFNILNVPNYLYETPEQFWNEYNKPFLDAAVKRGDIIIVATSQNNLITNRVNDGIIERSGFGREIDYLKKTYNYYYDEKSMEMKQKAQK